MGAAEGHALEPQFQRLPVDAGDDAQGEERHAQEGAEQRGRRPVARLAGDGGEQKLAFGIVVVDARQLNGRCKWKRKR
jgi:hypothetical protein